MSNFQFTSCFKAYLFLQVGCLLGAPIDETGEMSDSEIEKYLNDFGYNDSSVDSQIRSLPDPSAVMELAIKKFQHMAGLLETGHMNEETKRWMKYPRCGVRDEISMGNIVKRRRRRFAPQGSRWGKNSITYKILNFSPDMGESTQISEIRRAFDVWEKHSPLRFTEVSRSPADIEIKFAEASHGDNFPFDGRGRTLAHAFFPQVSGNVHLDDAEDFTAWKDSGTNLFQVLAHEFGHSLGLGHSSDRSALMAPFYRGYLPNVVLHSDDINGIQHIYGPSPSGTTTTTTKGSIPPIPAPSGTSSPEICSDGTFDAIARYEADTYLFRGNMFAKLNKDELERGYPRMINASWPGIPDNLDAALYWPAEYDTSINQVTGESEQTVREVACTFFFKGPDFWKYNNTGMVNGYPKTISIGFPGLPSDLDAAFVWSGNGKTYFIKDQKYYRYTRRQGVDSSYPKPLSAWDGLPSNIDAAFQWHNGRTYFFNGPNYYRFNDRQFTVDTGYPRLNKIWWLGCPDSSAGSDVGEMELSENDDQFIDIPTATVSIAPVSGTSAIGQFSISTILALIFAALL